MAGGGGGSFLLIKTLIGSGSGRDSLSGERRFGAPAPPGGLHRAPSALAGPCQPWAAGAPGAEGQGGADPGSTLANRLRFLALSMVLKAQLMQLVAWAPR